MDFSSAWKSGCTIGGSYVAPLLVSGDDAKSLGPLLFSPDGPPEILLPFPVGPPSTPDLPSPPFLLDSLYAFQRSFHHFLPFSTLSSVAHEDNDYLRGYTNLFFGNALRSLKCSNGLVLLMFPSGNNGDEIGGVFFCGSDPDPRRRVRAEVDGNAFKLSRSYFGHRILQFSVTQKASAGWDSSTTEGFLLTCTSYDANWYRIDVSDSRPVLLPLAHARFGDQISCACWSPHIPEESAIILSNGELRLFDLNSSLEPLKKPTILHGRVVWNDSGCYRDDAQTPWWSCDFAWHPRIFILACGIVVLLVDSRNKDAQLSIMAKIEVCDSFRFHSLESDRFVAFCKSRFDDFLFAVTSNYYLLLFDLRQPLTPLLQWDHGVCNPRYVEFHTLSDLRPSDGQFKWASKSGFVILVGSLRSCEFGVFCWGPHPRIPSTIDCLNPVYAWELPTELKLRSNDCSCSACIVQQISYADGSDQDRLSGFSVIPVEGNSLATVTSYSEEIDHSDCRGFDLVKLWESGKLEYQHYKSTWKSVCTRVQTSSLDNLVLERDAGTDEACVKFKRFSIKYLLKYLEGGSHLADLLDSQKQNFASDGVVKGGIKKSDTEASRELLKGLLELAGLSSLRDKTVEGAGEKKNASFLSLTNLLNDISMPSSIYEIACTRLWTSLSLNLLQCAFFKYSDLCVRQKRLMHFPEVPLSSVSMRYPPFFLRLPSMNHERSASEASSNALVGPVLPFPFLLAVHQMNKDMTSYASDDKSGSSLVDLQVDSHCEEILKTCEKHVSSEASFVVPEPFISLSDDKETCVDSHELQDENPLLFIHKPVIGFELRETNGSKGLGNNHHSSVDFMQSSSYSGRRFHTFVSRKRPHHTLDCEEKDFLQEFDDLCPINLSFSNSKLNTTPEGTNVLRRLMGLFSQWQDGVEHYKNCVHGKSS